MCGATGEHTQLHFDQDSAGGACGRRNRIIGRRGGSRARPAQAAGADDLPPPPIIIRYRFINNLTTFTQAHLTYITWTPLTASFPINYRIRSSLLKIGLKSNYTIKGIITCIVLYWSTYLLLYTIHSKGLQRHVGKLKSNHITFQIVVPDTKTTLSW